MNQYIATCINDYIKSLGYTNVHLLGKCNGSWIALEMFLMGKGFFKGLYLAVPGIPPIGIIKRLEKYKNSKILFGWIKQDGFFFQGCRINQFYFLILLKIKNIF